VADELTAHAELVVGGANLRERRNPTMSGNYRNDPGLNDAGELETGDVELVEAEQAADAEETILMGHSGIDG